MSTTAIAVRLVTGLTVTVGRRYGQETYGSGTYGSVVNTTAPTTYSASRALPLMFGGGLGQLRFYGQFNYGDGSFG